VPDPEHETISAPSPGTEEANPRLPFIVMEFLDGETLFRFLHRNRSMSVEQTLDLFLPILSALGAAHARGVVHRDMKPGNIMLTKTPEGGLRPTVLDFGVAKLLGGQEDRELSVDGSVLGTPAYWSPEQALGATDIDGRSDQYTVATMIYQSIAGRRPYDAAGIQLVHKIIGGDFVPLRQLVDNLPPGLDDIVSRAMARHPEQRFASIREFARALLPYATPRAQARWAPAFEPGGTVRPPGSRSQSRAPATDPPVQDEDLRPDTMALRPSVAPPKAKDR
jgi:serine/threonine-protein kinase